MGLSFCKFPDRDRDLFSALRISFFAGVSTSVLVILSPTTALAQVEGDDGSLASQPKLEEIVVTAQRRRESVQDTPLAVSAFSGETLNRSGITSVRDIGQIDASLRISNTTGVVEPFLRGTGNPAGSAIGNEASVPVYIDDVYFTRLSTAYLELNSVERVEILKGPQGTLFGRNSSGGTIQFFTRDPGRDPAVDVMLGYGNYDTVTAKLYGSTPITDTLGINVSVAAQRQGDGFGTNLTTGHDIYRGHYVSVRSKLVWKPSATTTVRIAGYYVYEKSSVAFDADRHSGTIGGTAPIYGPPQPILSFGDRGHIYDAAIDVDPFQLERGGGGSIRIDQALDFADIVSISAYRRSTGLGVFDGDFTFKPYLRYDLYQKDRQISQELQVKSEPSSKVSWILGSFYLNSQQGYQPTYVNGDALGAGNTVSIFGKQTINSYSAYGQTTVPVMSTTNVTAGLRFTKDQVRGRGYQNFIIDGVGSFPLLAADGGQDPYNKQFNFKKLTYKAAIDHHFTRDIMAYASVSRGYKSGTFNTLPLDTDPADAEVVDAYEIGLKTEIFDRRLRLNMAIFQNDIKNPQVYTTITKGSISAVGLTNARKARVKGGEFSAQIAVTKELTLRGGGTYLDAKYVSFENAPFFLQNSSPPYGTTRVFRSANGNTLSKVPKYQFNLGINYNVSAPFGTFNLDANYAYTGKFAWNADNIIIERSVGLLNTGLTYYPPNNDHLSLRIWAKNLTNEKYYGGQAPIDGESGGEAHPAPPRTFGVEARLKY